MRQAISALLLLIVALPAAAQEAKKPFTLRWYGQSFIQIETPGGKKVVFDPHAIPAFGRPMVAADILCISHEHDDHTQVEVLESKGREFRGLTVPKGKAVEWTKINEKVGAISVRTVGTFHDQENGLARGKNAVFIIEADGLKFVHLGDLGHDLTDEQVKAIGACDVLMIPVGGVYTINGDVAKKVVAKLKPRLYVVPMHYAVPGYDDLVDAAEFLENNPLPVKKSPLTNELTIAADEKAETATVVMLHWQKTIGNPKK